MFQKVINNLLDEWIYFFKNEEIKDNFHSEGFKRAVKRLNYLKLKKAEQREYDIFIDNLRLEKSLALSKEIDFNLAVKKGGKKGRKKVDKKEQEKTTRNSKKSVSRFYAHRNYNQVQRTHPKRNRKVKLTLINI